MGNEIELKFLVAPRELRKLKAARVLHRKPPKEENLVSVYFDTPKARTQLGLHHLPQVSGPGLRLAVRFKFNSALRAADADDEATEHID